ncbi:MAG: O-methyltransferase [Bacteroidetes bacterium]|nr:O-methyltransferase [Bacteroidota bacterium]
MPIPFIIDKAIQYSDVFTTPAEPLLQKILDETRATHPKAHMLSGEVQGQFLSMLSCLKSPVNILEIGTFTGYSALCLAKGLTPSGVLHTIESRPEDAQTASKYFEQSKYAHQIKLHVGDAKEIIPTLPLNWDLVFIDADKTGYTQYYEMVVPMLAKGGIIIADNVLFHGEVLEETISGKNAAAINAFNEHVKNDTRTSQVLLTIRDGMLLIQKNEL